MECSVWACASEAALASNNSRVRAKFFIGTLLLVVVLKRALSIRPLCVLERSHLHMCNAPAKPATLTQNIFPSPVRKMVRAVADVLNSQPLVSNSRLCLQTADNEVKMAASSPHEVTQLLLAWNNGDEATFAQLAPLVQAELHRLAVRYLKRERAGHMLQATALVNEAYLQLIDAHSVQWQNRAHFFGMAAQMMRRVLVEHARERQ